MCTSNYVPAMAPSSFSKVDNKDSMPSFNSFVQELPIGTLLCMCLDSLYLLLFLVYKGEARGTTAVVREIWFLA